MRPSLCCASSSFKLLVFVPVQLRRGLSPWAFSYTLISCANADKKRLNVISLACLPVACCHACLALLTLCLSCSIAKRTACSSEQSIIGLRPTAGTCLQAANTFAQKAFHPCIHRYKTHLGLFTCFYRR